MADRYGVIIGLTGPRERVSKRSVDYRKADAATRRCGTCVMYHASRCDLVDGYIEPNYVCDRWAAKPRAVELADSDFVSGGPAVRHVRSARGVAFFKEPVGTPITEAQYQSLLAARQAAKRQYEPGHPDRVAAERAVRQARK